MLDAKTTSMVTQKSDTAELIDRHCDSRFRFAMSRLHNAALAEDIVQETFLAALKSVHTFSDRSSELTWLIGVMKHKICDHYRCHFRSHNLTSTTLEETTVEHFFDDTGHWIEGSNGTQIFEPESNLLIKEIRSAIGKSLGQIPRKLAYIFTLREIDGMTTDEIGKLLGISKENVWVSLHRARLYLRKELESFH